MSFSKKITLAFFFPLLLTACMDESNYVVEPVNVKFATYNLSFDRNDYESLLDELQTPVDEQKKLVQAYLANELEADAALKTKAAKVIQIRNVAAAIQAVRPDVLMLAEFNNDGKGEDKTALVAFQNNYLSVSQSSTGAGGNDDLAPIQYPFQETYATNTGRLNEFGFDLNKDGETNTLPGDAWGYGLYHGQYAFALMSKFEIDTANTRTFQNFKWKDLAGAENPKIASKEWYSADAWQEVLLSSKNHVDAPILIPTVDGVETVHLLLSHPTPPAFDTGKNIIQNAAEVEFWQHYINNASFLYDDKGKKGGLVQGKHFVIMGDLNLDADFGNGLKEVMQSLQQDPLLNQNLTLGGFFPISQGAVEYASQPTASANAKAHPLPERLTSEFGLAVDYAIPSASMRLRSSGVFWPATYEKYYALFIDERVGKGSGKDVNSDHRMVWFEANFSYLLMPK